MNRFASPLKWAVLRLSRTRYVRSAIAERAGLSAFRRRPGPKVIVGVSAIAFSYVIGWPLVSLLGAAAVYTGNAAIALVGGPLAYGLSHLVFILGMYLAGAKYSRIFFRWATRVAMERLLAGCGLSSPAAPPLPDVAMVAGHDERGGGDGPPAADPSRAGGRDRAGGQAGDQGEGGDKGRSPDEVGHPPRQRADQRPHRHHARGES